LRSLIVTVYALSGIAVKILFNTYPVAILSSNYLAPISQKKCLFPFFKAGVSVETSAELDLQTQSAHFSAGPLRPAFSVYLVK
jgi:hypothetical protein